MPGTAAPSRRRTLQPAPAPHTHSTADAELTASLDAAGTPVVASTAATGTTRERLRLLGWRAWLFVAALICAAAAGRARPRSVEAGRNLHVRHHPAHARDRRLRRADQCRPAVHGKPPLYAWSRPARRVRRRCTTPGSRARCSPHWHSASSRGARRQPRATWLGLRVIGPVVLSAGTLVVIKHVHDMMTDVALFAGTAIAFCGLLELVMQHVTRAQQMRHGLPVRPSGRWAAPIFGAGVGIALMTKGLFVPLVLAATLVGALVFYPACRTRARSRARSASQHWCSRRSRSSGRPHCSCARDAVHDVVLG